MATNTSPRAVRGLLRPSDDTSRYGLFDIIGYPAEYTEDITPMTRSGTDADEWQRFEAAVQQDNLWSLLRGFRFMGSNDPSHLRGELMSGLFAEPQSQTVTRLSEADRTALYSASVLLSASHGLTHDPAFYAEMQDRLIALAEREKFETADMLREYLLSESPKKVDPLMYGWLVVMRTQVRWIVLDDEHYERFNDVLRDNQSYSDEELIAALRLAHKEFGKEQQKLTGGEGAKTAMSRDWYVNFAAENGLPSWLTVIRPFGTWNEAVRAAELPVNPSHRAYESVSDDELLDQIIECARENNLDVARLSFPVYSGWATQARANGRDVMAAITTRVRFNRWTLARLAAVERASGKTKAKTA